MNQVTQGAWNKEALIFQTDRGVRMIFTAYNRIIMDIWTGNNQRLIDVSQIYETM